MSTMNARDAALPNGETGGENGNENGFETQARTVVERLQLAIRALIEGTPGVTRRPTDLSRTLGIDSKMAWRVHRMAHADDPFTEIAHLPRPAAMERFLEAAARRGAPEKRTIAVRLAVMQYEDLVNHHAGGRAEFVSMVSSLAESGSEHVELGHRRAMFKGQSHFLGVQSKGHLGCFIYHPSANDPERMDCAVIRGKLGVRRLRRNASWVLSRTKAIDEDSVVRQPVVREPIDPAVEAECGVSLMKDYCTLPLPKVERVPAEMGLTDLVVTGEDVGNASTMTCIAGEVFRRAFGRYQDEHNRVQFSQTLVRIPGEVILQDVYVHESLDWSQEAELRVYTDHRGVDPALPGRECDLVTTQEEVVYLGQGLSVVDSEDVDRYTDMMRESFDRLQWNPDEFHVYRFRMEYPLMPSSVIVQFELPRHR